jgi:gliding motility-associated-like protein
MPTAFSPNGDGVNDIFRSRFNCNVSAFEFMIFNKWGQKIFETKDVNKGWDGTYNGKKLSLMHMYMSCSTVLYLVQEKTAKGTVVLIR